MDLNLHPEPSVAAERYNRGLQLSAALIAAGLFLSAAHGALATGTLGPLLYAGLALILTGVSAWTAAAYIHDRATENNNGS